MMQSFPDTVDSRCFRVALFEFFWLVRSRGVGFRTVTLCKWLDLGTIVLLSVPCGTTERSFAFPWAEKPPRALDSKRFAVPARASNYRESTVNALKERFYSGISLI